MEPATADERTCRSTDSLLDPFLSGELPEEKRHEVSRHVNTCPRCSKELARRTGLKQALRKAVSREAVPLDLEKRILGRIRAAEPRRTAAWGWQPSLAFAAALLVLLGSWIAWRRPQQPPASEVASEETFIDSLYEQVAPIFRVGLGDHLHCAHFRKFPEDPAAFERMAEQMGPEYAPLVETIHAKIGEPLQIVLAHRCSYRGRRFVHVAMRSNKTLLSVVITRKEPGESFSGSDLRSIRNESGVDLFGASADGFEVAGFATRDHLAFVVSDLAPDDNARVALNVTPALHQFLTALES